MRIQDRFPWRSLYIPTNSIQHGGFALKFRQHLQLARGHIACLVVSHFSWCVGVLVKHFFRSANMSKRFEIRCDAERRFYLYCTKCFVRWGLSNLQRRSTGVHENNVQQSVWGSAVQQCFPPALYKGRQRDKQVCCAPQSWHALSSAVYPARLIIGCSREQQKIYYCIHIYRSC